MPSPPTMVDSRRRELADLADDLRASGFPDESVVIGEAAGTLAAWQERRRALALAGRVSPDDLARADAALLEQSERLRNGALAGTMHLLSDAFPVLAAPSAFPVGPRPPSAIPAGVGAAPRRQRYAQQKFHGRPSDRAVADPFAPPFDPAALDDRELRSAIKVWRAAVERVAARWLKVARIVDCTPDAALRERLYDQLLGVAADVDAKRKALGLLSRPLFRTRGRRGHHGPHGVSGPLAAWAGLGLAVAGGVLLTRIGWGMLAREREWEALAKQRLDGVLDELRISGRLTARQVEQIARLDREVWWGQEVRNTAGSVPHAALRFWNNTKYWVFGGVALLLVWQWTRPLRKRA